MSSSPEQLEPCHMQVLKCLEESFEASGHSEKALETATQLLKDFVEEAQLDARAPSLYAASVHGVLAITSPVSFHKISQEELALEYGVDPAELAKLHEVMWMTLEGKIKQGSYDLDARRKAPEVLDQMVMMQADAIPESFFDEAFLKNFGALPLCEARCWEVGEREIPPMLARAFMDGETPDLKLALVMDDQGTLLIFAPSMGLGALGVLVHLLDAVERVGERPGMIIMSDAALLERSRELLERLDIRGAHAPCEHVSEYDVEGSFMTFFQDK